MPTAVHLGPGSRALKMESTGPFREPLQLFISYADIVGQRFVVQFREQEFSVIGRESKMLVFILGEDSPVGVVRLGSSISGAIWRGDECIADYVRDDDGRYSVVPIDQGFRQPERCTDVDPLVHLLSRIEQSRERQ